MIEQWKPVVGYEGLYEVSDMGRVRAPAKISSSGLKLKARVLKTSLNDRGRRQFGVCVNGVEGKLKVHTEVLKAFVGPRPEGFDGCHKDDVPTNNHLSNLKWASKSENHGGDKKRNRNYSSKYNGVCHLKNLRWRAQVKVCGKQKHIGIFDTEIEAAKAFNQYCIENSLDKHLNVI